MRKSDEPICAEVDVEQEVERASTVWTTEREPPEQLLAHMLPYQKEGLGWLCSQEEGTVRPLVITPLRPAGHRADDLTAYALEAYSPLLPWLYLLGARRHPRG